MGLFNVKKRMLLEKINKNWKNVYGNVY